MSKKAIKLGDEVEDIISKTVGIVVGRAEYLSGAVYWIIQPTTSDDNAMLRVQEIPEAYCKWRGDGVYPSTKPPTGFQIGDKRDARKG